MTTRKQPWEQQRSEPPSAYAHFLLYRNLGPGRSLDDAFAESQVTKGDKRRAPGNWQRESARWNWHERATAWDIAMLTEVGEQIVVGFVAFIKALSQQALRALSDPTVRPRSWEDLLTTAQVISSLIDPQVVTAALTAQKLRCL